MNKTLTDFEPATRDDVMRYLARGFVDFNLPSPRMIHTVGDRANVQLDDLTDMYTWVNWLGAGAPGAETYEFSDGTSSTFTWSEVAWEGWTIRVSLTNRRPVTP